MPMRALICLIGLLLLPTAAHADETVQIIRKKTLFLLEDYHQWVGASYSFMDHDSGARSDSSSSHQIEEFYHADLAGSVLDPHILSLGISGEFRANQLRESNGNGGSTASDRLNYQYGISASLLDRMPYSMTVGSSRTTNIFTSPFAPTLTADTMQNTVSANLRNKYIPLRFHYMGVSVDVNGGGRTASSTMSQFSLEGRHSYKGISSTSGSLSSTTSSGESNGATATTGRSYSAALANTLTFDRQGRHALQSLLEVDDSLLSGIKNRTVSWSEILTDRYGAALDSSLAYYHQDNSTTGFSGRNQTSKSDSITGTVRHRLFSSLTTRLSGRYRISNMLDGTETQTAASVGVGYTKMLPSSQLSLDVSREYEVTDRNVASSDLAIPPKRFSVTQGFQVIDLHPGGTIKPLSVVVTGYSVPPATPQVVPDVTYQENIDFTVDYTTGLISWGALPPPVPDVVVSFTAHLDPSLKYSTSSTNIVSTVSFLGGRYTVSGSYGKQSQSVVSGSSSSFPGDVQTLMLRLQANMNQHVASLSYFDYDSGTTAYWYTEGRWQSSYRFGESTVLSFSAQDRYRENAGRAGNDGSWVNTASVIGRYQRPLALWATMNASASLLNMVGSNLSMSDFISADINVRMTLNKLIITAGGQTSFRIYGGTTMRDDRFNLALTRYF